MEETRYSFSEAEYQALKAKADECADFERRLAEDVANLTASLAAEVTESEALRAALATAQQEKAEALALLGMMREALEPFAYESIHRVQDAEAIPFTGVKVSDCDRAAAALSTPAPAALEEMRERVAMEHAQAFSAGWEAGRNEALSVRLEWEELAPGIHRAPAPLFGSIRLEQHRGTGAWEVLWSVPGYCNRLVGDESGFPTLAAAKQAADEHLVAAIRAMKREGEG